MKWPEIWGLIGPQRVRIYADFIDPFCYVGFYNIARAAKAERIALDWRGFELNPDTPAEGSLLQTAANSDLQPGMWASVRDFAKKFGLVLAEPSHVPNTRLAHLWVQSIAKPDVKNSLIERIYQAYLSDEKDVGDRRVLEALAAAFGLPKNGIPTREEAQRGGARLERFREEAMMRKFPGMPGFVYRGKTYFGALSEDAWKKIMEEKARV
jgi:predicted DsbA family dithiol-disulfide isomerase